MAFVPDSLPYRQTRSRDMRVRWLAAFLLLVSTGLIAGEQEFAVERIKLVPDIAQLTQQSAAETGRSKINPAVLAAMERTPRHRFVPEEQRRYAYHNRPLPIGYGQTI